MTPDVTTTTIPLGHTNFWEKLTYPVVGLSPMDGVTDQPFRYIQKKYGQPDIVYTEFTSVEGVCHGADRLLKDFMYDETQRPAVAQIYGFTPEHFRQTAVVLCELGFDGIDINMGCPAKNVAHSGAGAALIKTPQLAQDIITATKAGVEDYRNGKRSRDCDRITESIWREVEKRHEELPELVKQRREIPVSVKTRVGFSHSVITEWVQVLLETEPAAIAVHGRTLKQHYTGEANWEELAKGAEIVRKHGIPYLGNGDIASRDHALEKIATYPMDGVLIGRASFGNPFVFQAQMETPPPSTFFELAIEHSYLFEKTYQHDERYNFLPMRKHLGWYAKGFPQASTVRRELFTTESAQGVEEILNGVVLS